MLSLEELLAEGERALERGDRLVARGYFRRAVRVDPDSLRAWLGLSRATEDVEERRRCYTRILDLDPENVEAREGLAALPPVAEGEGEADTPEEKEHAGGEGEGSAPARGEQNREVEVPEIPLSVMGVLEGPEAPCKWHPDRMTTLRCNRCGAPICSECAVRTPVGFRCKQCVREQEALFYNARPVDYLVAFLVAMVLGGIGALIANALGVLLTFFVAPAAGALIGDWGFRAIGRRRGRWIWLVMSVGVVVGALGALGMLSLFLAQGAILALTLLNPSFWLYVVIAVSGLIGMLRFGRRR